MGFLSRVPCLLAVVALVLVLSCFHPAYWKLPWFASSLRPVDPGEAVLVTGASTGIGKLAALSLAKTGFTVFCGVRRLRDGEALVAAASKNGIDAARVKPLLLDVTNSAQIAAAYEEVSTWLGPERGLSALFNNAAVGGDAPKPGLSNAVEHQSMEKYREAMDVNFFGTVAVTKTFLALLRKARGRILMSSSLAILGTPFQSTYAASKIAMEGWADSLHREIMVRGMHVSILQLGFVTTPLLKKQADALGPDVHWQYDAENYPHEAAWWKAYFALMANSYPPTHVTEVVLHAVLAGRPARRYLAGFGSEFMRLTPRLPHDILDQSFDGNMLLKFLNLFTTEDDVRSKIQSCEQEFEL